MIVQHSNDGLCLAMNAVSSRTSSSPPSSAATAAALAAAAAAAVVIHQTSTTISSSASSTSSASSSLLSSTMAVTSTVPPGARSASPCSAAATPYGSGSGGIGSSSGPGSGAGGLISSVVGGATGPSTPGAPGSHQSQQQQTQSQSNNNNNNRCCDTGRTIFTDPVSGQTLCSCQYDMLNYQRLAAAGGLVAAAGPGGVPLGVYPEGMSAYLSGMGADQPAFYANPAGLDLKENLVGGGAPWPYPSVYHPYDAAFAGYPFNSYGMDLNGARRKNATRETTSTLKAWLNEHKKNPYPTKGEKIMLAIITKMTLTQVSTWFANARRRLKKENKMTWEPRNRVDDDDANVDDDDHKSNDDKDMLDAKDSGLGSNEDGDRPSHRLGDMLGDRPGEGNNSEWSGSRPGSPNGSPDLYDRPGGGGILGGGGGHPLFHPAALHHHFRPPAGSPPDIAAFHHHHQQHLLQQHHQQQSQHNALHHQATHGGVGGGGILGSGTTNPSLVKPRIWSLADMASKDGKDSASKDSPPSHHQQQSDAVLPPHPSSIYGHVGGQHSSPGKILSPLAARIPNYSPYVRPDLYRGFYGPAAAHLTGPTSEFLEHQRSFGASLAAHNGLSMNPLLWKAAVSGAGGPPFAPLSLTTSNHHQHVVPPSGVSPSASSTSSSIGCSDVQQPPSTTSQPSQHQQHQHQHQHQRHHHQQQGPISGNSTSSSNSSSGKLSPAINVTSMPGKP